VIVDFRSSSFSMLQGKGTAFLSFIVLFCLNGICVPETILVYCLAS